MKNTIKLLEIITLAVIIGLSFTACDEDGNGDGDGIASGMDTLNLSGKVYLQTYNDSDYSVSYSNYNGDNLTIDDGGIGGSGTVTNGNLSYSVGIPSVLYAFDQEDVEYLLDGYYQIILSTPVLQGYTLFNLRIENSGGYIYKGSSGRSINNNSSTGTFEEVFYVYVDDDITITGIGGTFDPQTEINGGTTYTYISIANNFSLSLKTGWNAIYQKIERLDVITEGSFENPTSITSTETRTFSLRNPSLRWLLQNYMSQSINITDTVLDKREMTGFQTRRQMMSNRLQSAKN
ncbi:MAG: hypothetical protein FWD26_00300 [Treponema sp.]|nr:hypothetical protein [Treponema sp.]